MSRAEGFAAVPNWMIRDRSIPRSAVLVYASLSSRSGMGAIFPSQATIAEESGVSERTVRTMLGKLEEAGVIERHRRNTKGKKRVTDGYTLHPNGNAANVSGGSDLPETGTASTGNEQQCVPLIEVDREEVDRDSAREALFDEFWAIWPRKESKKTARAAWARAVKKTDAQRIIAAARALVASPHRSEDRFMPYGASWLNQERWNDPLPTVGRYAGGAVAQGLAVDRMIAERERGELIRRGEIVGLNGGVR